MRMGMDLWTRLLRSCWQMRRANYLKTNAGGSSRGLISASRAWRSTAFLAACQTRQDHLRVLRASAFICVKTFLSCSTSRLATWAETVRERSLPRPQPVRGSIDRHHCAGVPARPAGRRDAVRMDQIGRFQLGPRNPPSRWKVPACGTTPAHGGSDRLLLGLIPRPEPHCNISRPND